MDRNQIQILIMQCYMSLAEAMTNKNQCMSCRRGRSGDPAGRELYWIFTFLQCMQAGATHRNALPEACSGKSILGTAVMHMRCFHYPGKLLMLGIEQIEHVGLLATKHCVNNLNVRMNDNVHNFRCMTRCPKCGQRTAELVTSTMVSAEPIHVLNKSTNFQ